MNLEEAKKLRKVGKKFEHLGVDPKLIYDMLNPFEKLKTFKGEKKFNITAIEASLVRAYSNYLIKNYQRTLIKSSSKYPLVQKELKIVSENTEIKEIMKENTLNLFNLEIRNIIDDIEFVLDDFDDVVELDIKITFKEEI